jgi:major membrane immunogen (membrane-anchored lipoprotein)
MSRKSIRAFGASPRRPAFARFAPFAAATGLLLILALAGCGGGSGAGASDAEGIADGVYTGVSSEDDKGAYGEVTITVKDGAVSACEFVTWQKDGSIKDEEYGKVNGEISNQEFYDKAQLAVRAMAQYAGDYARLQDAGEVEAVSGATISHGQFLEAVADALAKAK